MSGPALVERMTAQGLRFRVLFVSGYADNTLMAHGVLEPGIHFLQKPCTPEVLAVKVREILDDPLAA